MSFSIVHEFVHANRTIQVVIDPEPMDPRKDWDPLTTIYHWHRRYDLGTRIDRLDEDEMGVMVAQKGEEILADAPLYLLDHSGISVNTRGFGCPWDSGRVGWVVLTKQRAEERGFDLTDPDHNPDWKAILEGEIREFDQYLRGEVYGFRILGLDGDELESCWGFYDLKQAEESAKDVAEHTEDPAIQRQVDELASRATLAG